MTHRMRSFLAPLALLAFASFASGAGAADIKGKEMTLAASEHPRTHTTVNELRRMNLSRH